ncbi:hypothetical protein C482_03734 [Natrialba chahannaoensis JCM 10990]|uniref:Uncharacterized protein n=1 Tax=Natrialba chahannaoensis JCM 10990 TaxID=1227492 RepID=M0AYE6_9EURY|nr:hypothetical protein [Natrialba chahannaoensis]ELZ03505.1 hypothetical protein C482_03734 [Natrialba chahannaoensis JCM 10990]
MDNSEEDQMKQLLMIIGVVMVAVIIINIISYVWMPFLPWHEERDAGQEVIEQTYNAEHAVSEYEWFRQQYHDIESQRAHVENAYGELDRFYDIHGENPNEWSRTAEEDHSRIQQRITGNQNQLDTLVEDYNARSSMDNRELFKCHLPYQVDERFAIRGPPGSGDADQPMDTDPDGNAVSGSPPPAEECDGLPDTIEN